MVRGLSSGVIITAVNAVRRISSILSSEAVCRTEQNVVTRKLVTLSSRPCNRKDKVRADRILRLNADWTGAGRIEQHAKI